MWRKIAFAFIIISLVFSVSDYFYTMHDSYNRYLEGEYFFRYKAKTILAMDQDAWFESVENFDYISSKDFSDTKTMLLYGGEFDVYACGPHDGVCTVIYGSQTVEDFPVSNLWFSGDDADYFYGTKKLTYEEYIDYVKSLSPEQLEDGVLVNTSRVASFKSVQNSLFVLFGMEGTAIIVFFILRKNEKDFSANLVLTVGALYVICFEIITAFMY